MTLDELVTKLTTLNKEGYDKLEVMLNLKSFRVVLEDIEVYTDNDSDNEPIYIILS